MSSSSSSSSSSFIPSSTWQGPKPGYYFGTTTQHGTGYHWDKHQQQKTTAVAAAASADDANDTATVNNRKKRGVQFDEDKNEMKILLLEKAEQQASNAYVVDLTPKGIQSASNALSKIVQKNAMLRTRYIDEPRQYMESEIQLYDQLTALSAIGAESKLYRHLEQSTNLMSTLLQLLGHDNSDIRSCVISLLFQLLDPTLTEDDPDCIPVLGRLASLVLHDAWETIVSNLYNTTTTTTTTTTDNGDDDDTQDQNLKGIDNTLSLMENLLELDTLTMATSSNGRGIVELVARQGEKQRSVESSSSSSSLSAAAFMVQESSIVSWLFSQIEQSSSSQSSSNGNNDGTQSSASMLLLAKSKEEEWKGRCMELITFLSQNADVFDVLPDWNQLPRNDIDQQQDNKTAEPSTKKIKRSSEPIEGIDLLLQSIGKYRKKQPTNDRQIEYLENACIALSSCITFSTTNLQHFVDLEGVPLIMYCEKNNVHSGCSALRLLDFAMDGSVAKQACEEVITSGLLKYIFPLFLGTRIPKPAATLKSIKSKRSWLNDIKTRTIRTLYGLSLHLDSSSPQDGQERFIAKFVEDNQKNCDRLVELLLEYDGKARKAEYKFFRSGIDETIGGVDGSNNDNEDDNDEKEQLLSLAAYDAKLKNGGDMCHRLAAIAAYVCSKSKRCHERILTQLKLQQAGISLIKDSLQEFSSSLRPGNQQDHIERLLEQI